MSCPRCGYHSGGGDSDWRRGVRHAMACGSEVVREALGYLLECLPDEDRGRLGVALLMSDDPAKVTALWSGVTDAEATAIAYVAQGRAAEVQRQRREPPRPPAWERVRVLRAWSEDAAEGVNRASGQRTYHVEFCRAEHWPPAATLSVDVRHLVDFRNVLRASWAARVERGREYARASDLNEFIAAATGQTLLAQVERVGDVRGVLATLQGRALQWRRFRGQHFWGADSVAEARPVQGEGESPRAPDGVRPAPRLEDRE